MYVCVAARPVVKAGVSRRGPEKQCWSQGETQERERGPARKVREEGKERERGIIRTRANCFGVGRLWWFNYTGLLASVSRPVQTCMYASVCLVVSDRFQCHSFWLAFNCLVLCCIADFEPCLLSCLCCSGGRVLCLESRVSWVLGDQGRSKENITALGVSD